MCGNFSYFFSLARLLTHSFPTRIKNEKNERAFHSRCVHVFTVLGVIANSLSKSVFVYTTNRLKWWDKKHTENFAYVLDWVVSLCVHAYNKFIYKNSPMPSFKEIIYPKYFLLSFSFTRSHHDYINDAIKNLFQHTFLLLNRNDIWGDEMRWW